MPVIVNSFTPEIIQLLLNGKIGIIRTDTLYGIIACADKKDAVERVFAIKHRNQAKSPIVLISSSSQLFDWYNDDVSEQLKAVWPGKNSIILPSSSAPQWIERGNKSVAYRLPDDQALQELVNKTGPLIAPSANPEGETPAMTIDEAIRYFGDDVDFYVDGGAVTDDAPSRLYRLQGDNMERLR